MTVPQYQPTQYGPGAQGAHAAPPPPGADPAPATDADVGGQSVGELIGDVTRDLSTLMRQELALAQAELKQEATKAAKGAGMFGGAGVAGYFVLLFLSIALWSGLFNVMDPGWAGLVRGRALGDRRRRALRGRAQEPAAGQSQARSNRRHPEARARRLEGPARRNRMTSASDPDQIRRDIERTQAALSDDVDALTEKVSPGKIVERRVDQVRSTATRWKDKVMGPNPRQSDTATSSEDGPHRGGNSMHDRAQDLQDQAQERAQDLQGRAQDVAASTRETLEQAPQTIRQQTRGNPLAAGLIAFGAGWLVSSLLPASRPEQELAGQARQAAQDAAQPLAQQAGQVANQMKENLRQPAQQAVKQVMSTATDAGQTVADQGRAAAGQVQGRAQDARNTVQEHTSR